jgi:hypothetical protein
MMRSEALAPVSVSYFLKVCLDKCSATGVLSQECSEIVYVRYCMLASYMWKLGLC